MGSVQNSLSDSHIHLFEYGFLGDQNKDFELISYSSIRECFGIDRALVVGYEGTDGCLGNNEYIRRLSQTQKWIAPLRYVNGRLPLFDVLEPEFFGYSIYLDDWTPSEDYVDFLQGAALSIMKIPIVSLNGTPESFARARNSLKRFNACKIFISHLGLPGRPAFNKQEAKLRLHPVLDLANTSDVYVKISGIYAFDSTADVAGSRAYVEVLLDTIGVKKLVWGSDFAAVLNHLNQSECFSLASSLHYLFSEQERQLIESRNLSDALDACKN